MDLFNLGLDWWWIFSKWVLRWSPRRDKWRPCSCELEDSCTGDGILGMTCVLKLRCEIYCTKFSWFGMDFIWCFWNWGKRKNTSKKVMILVNRLPSILFCFIFNQVNPLSFLQTCASAIGNPWFPYLSPGNNKSWSELIWPRPKRWFSRSPISSALGHFMVKIHMSWLYRQWI